MPFSRSQFSGFPFSETDSDYDRPFQSRLNDLAARHPEFASHFRGLDDFPSLRRKRQPHQHQQHQHQETEAGSAGSSSSRAFPSAFDRFPFAGRWNDFPEGEESRRGKERGEYKADKPPEVPKDKDNKDKEPRGRKPNPNLPQHLSNTVDLGKQQSPAERSQRSMSAPPENRSSRDPDPDDMGHKFSRQTTPQAQPQPPPSSQPKERIIPIHVEGRDDPVMPKNPNIPTEKAEKVFGGERFQRADPNAHIRRQAYEQFVPQKPPTPPPQQQQQPQKEQQQQQQQQPKKEQTPPPSNDPLIKIKSVRSDVMALMSKVEQFDGTRKDKEYLYLDEMLTRNLLKLDNVETEGKDNIRQARKEAIKCIQTCISNLEAKAQAKEMSLKSEPAETPAPTSEAEAPVEEEPQKFTSQATLIIAPPSEPQQKQQKIEETEKMEVEKAEEEQSSQETK